MPKSTGRFNVLILRANDCHVIFKPSDTPIQVAVATELEKEQAFELMDELNNAMDDTCNRHFRQARRDSEET